ncbi:hypothetical protein CLAIMM_04693 [Cladophialophora immunda]|nr:hypothetical protein CLAIMM_04693 [Cladophialophora immunda]
MLCVFRQHGFPVLDVWYLIETQTGWIAESGTNCEAICTNIGSFMFNARPGHYPDKIVLIEPDVNIHEVQDILWAYSTRCHPQRTSTTSDWVTCDFQDSYPEEVKSRVENRWAQMGTDGLQIQASLRCSKYR